MKRRTAIRLGLAGFLAGSLAVAAPVSASAFWPGTVIKVAYNDVLNLRKWPGSSSRIIGIAGPGQRVSLTGRCKDIKTNQSFQIDGPQSAKQKYAWMKRANVWCQVMTNSAGLGWARGSFIWPE